MDIKESRITLPDITTMNITILYIIIMGIAILHINKMAIVFLSKQYDKGYQNTGCSNYDRVQKAFYNTVHTNIS